MAEIDYVILGGGAAGLSAAMRLLELGISPYVVEGGSYPAHKVCGEFFSPSSLPILNRWNIHPLPIHQAIIHSGSHQFTFDFPSPAGSLSHLSFDPLLAECISQRGATLLTHTKVEELHPAMNNNERHRLVLSTGETLFAKHLFISTGRIPQFSVPPSPPCYMGFKAHFEGLELNSSLRMFTFPGAYLGLVPIENNHANLACLARLELVQTYPSPQQFMNALIQKHPTLCELLSSGRNLFKEWMEARVPEFGLRFTPDWPRTYFIGDAVGTIPPATGRGLSFAITSGYLSAEFAVQDNPKGFKKMWSKRCKSPLFFGKVVHHAFLNPFINAWCLRVANCSPFLAQQIYALTRDPDLSISNKA